MIKMNKSTIMYCWIKTNAIKKMGAYAVPQVTFGMQVSSSIARSYIPRGQSSPVENLSIIIRD
jgi:hypothetical protein